MNPRDATYPAKICKYNLQTTQCCILYGFFHVLKTFGKNTLLVHKTNILKVFV